MKKNWQDHNISVFVAYSHKDEPFKNKLVKHLNLLKKERLIGEIWHDGNLNPGDNFSPKIKEALLNTQIILPLVSIELLNSDFFFKNELPVIIERIKKEECIMIPIIVSYCHWQGTELGIYEVLPQKGKPLSAYDQIDEGLDQIIKQIRKKIINDIKQGNLIQDVRSESKNELTLIKLIAERKEKRNLHSSLNRLTLDKNQLHNQVINLEEELVNKEDYLSKLSLDLNKSKNKIKKLSSKLKKERNKIDELSKINSSNKKEILNKNELIQVKHNYFDLDIKYTNLNLTRSVKIGAITAIAGIMFWVDFSKSDRVNDLYWISLFPFAYFLYLEHYEDNNQPIFKQLIVIALTIFLFWLTLDSTIRIYLKYLFFGSCTIAAIVTFVLFIKIKVLSYVQNYTETKMIEEAANELNIQIDTPLINGDFLEPTKNTFVMIYSITLVFFIFVSLVLNPIYNWFNESNLNMTNSDGLNTIWIITIIITFIISKLDD